MRITLLCAMLLFIVPCTKAVAQQKQTQYQVTKLCKDSLIVKDGMRLDTMGVIDAVRINQSYPKLEQEERNRVIFKEMRKPE